MSNPTLSANFLAFNFCGAIASLRDTDLTPLAVDSRKLFVALSKGIPLELKTSSSICIQDFSPAPNILLAANGPPDNSSKVGTFPRILSAMPPAINFCIKPPEYFPGILVPIPLIILSTSKSEVSLP